VKISSKRIRLTTHMLDSEDGRITNDSFIMDHRMGYVFLYKANVEVFLP
jgi:nitrous oxidase accessory protein NosD